MDDSVGTNKRNTLNLSSSVFLIASDGRTLQLPIPSRSDRDPLNWSRAKRAGAFISLFVFSSATWIVRQYPILIFPAMAEEFGQQDIRPFRIDSTLVAQTLTLGIGTLFWTPISLALGRRSALLYSVPILLAGLIWAALSQKFAQIVIAVSIQGFSEGSSIVVLLALIDLTFIHQRPLTIGAFYVVTGFSQVGIVSLMPQIVSLAQNLRKTFLLWEIPVLISGICLLFLVPETYFLRPALAFDGRVLVQSATEKLEIYPDWDSSPAAKELPDLPDVKWRLWLRQLKFWDFKDGSWEACIHCCMQMLFCFFQPLLFWVIALRCIMSTGISVIARTYGKVLMEEPYSLPTSRVALINVAGVVGILASWPASSFLITKTVRLLSMRNKGIRKAQFYLPALLMPVLLMTTAHVLYASVVKFNLPFILYCLAFFLACFAYTAIQTATTTWVIEAFPRNAAAALAATEGCVYPSTFGLSFAVMPWIEDQGMFATNLQLAAIIFLSGFISISLAFWGEDIRQNLKGKWARNDRGALRPQISRSEVEG